MQRLALTAYAAPAALLIPATETLGWLIGNPIAPAPRAEIEAAPQPRRRFFSCRKIGGLTFIRAGRLSASFCLSRKPV